MAEVAKKGKDVKPAKKEKKPRKSIGQFFRETVAELKKVTWPTRKELLTNTGAVIAFIVVMAMAVGLMDWGLSALLALLVQ